MSVKRKTTRYTGVYERISDKRTFQGKPDACYDITYKVDGKKTWEKVGWLSEGYSAKLAGNIRAERMRSIRHSEELPKDKKRAPSFSAVADRYLEWAKHNKARAGIDDESRYKNHLKDRLSNKNLDTITPFDLEKMKIELTKKGLSPATVKHCLVLVRMIINKAVAWGMWEGENPVRKVKLPQPENERERFLTFDEAKALLKGLHEKSIVVHDMALISLHCGLRLGEITGLRGVDVDLKNGMINIANPKNKRPRKAVMTKAVKEMLKGRIPEDPEGYIFSDRRHKDRIIGISHTFPKVVDELKLNQGIADRRQLVTFHTLRHTHASWLAQGGESLLVIREALGHKDLQMVKRYAHLGADSRKQAAHRLEATFNKACDVTSEPHRRDKRKRR